MDGIPTPDRMNSPLAPDDPDARLDVRQARLRPEFAAEYPGIDADVWYPAKMLADYHRAWLARRPHPAGDGRERVLDPEHFEFRGGRPHGGPWTPGVSGDRRER